MKKKWGEAVAICLIAISIIFISINTYAHSGRTDAYGGHKDNKNKSGLGSYHYHCGGNPPHLHKNGVCPYSSSKSTKKTTAKKTSTTTKTTSKTTTKKTVTATGIKIKDNVSEMEEGTTKYLTAEITPNNVTNKKITWKSSNKDIVSVDEDGYIKAKKSGTANITATTSNGKTSTIKIKVKEKEYIQPKSTYKSNVISESVNITNTTVNSSEDSDIGGTIAALGLLGGGSYLGYKKYKNQNNNESKK